MKATKFRTLEIKKFVALKLSSCTSLLISGISLTWNNFHKKRQLQIVGTKVWRLLSVLTIKNSGSYGSALIFTNPVPLLTNNWTRLNMVLIFQYFCIEPGVFCQHGKKYLHCIHTAGIDIIL